MKTEEKRKLPCQKFKQQKINEVLYIPFVFLLGLNMFLLFL